MYKLNLLIDGHVYGDVASSTKELDAMAKIITNLLDAAKACRSGEVPRDKQKMMAEKVIPMQIKREDFWDDNQGVPNIVEKL